MTATVGLDRYEYRIDVCQCFRVITFQNPALLRGIVLVENPQVYGLLPVRTPPAPRLERVRLF